MIDALDIQVKGIVQGVGFRPFVYRMAKKYLINGWVLNASDGVRIHAEGESALIDEFVLELSEHAPAASHVTEIELHEVPLEGFDSFEIRFSDDEEVEQTTLVSPDLATCDDCVHELFNPNDRRFRYPFINCTNCGPRFTIIEKLPYDRASTSMRSFRMCERCAAEYDDPANRRFHAQPNACFACGPHISWLERPVSAAIGDSASDNCAPTENVSRETIASDNCEPTENVSRETIASDNCEPTEDVSRETIASPQLAEDLSAQLRWGTTREESDAIFARAVDVLLEGGIVAVKGLGGFHLVCDARNPQAVSALRARKRRAGKAFAVMMADVDAVRSVCKVNEVEETVLQSEARPIVLLKKRTDVRFTPQLADGLSELGVMLPSTPVQHILMHDFAEASKAMSGTANANGTGNTTAGAENTTEMSTTEKHVDATDKVGEFPMLVMTSGNIHEEPIVIDDAEVYDKLGGIADAFLGNDRAILTRFDDSVVRVIEAGSAGYAVQFIRRARGYAPLPLDANVSRETSQSSEFPKDNQADLSENVSRETFSSVLFATGPEQKNTFTLMRGTEAFVSQHIGDMENAATFDAWLQAKRRFELLFDAKPQMIVCDTHPEYLTSKWAHDTSCASETVGAPNAASASDTTHSPNPPNAASASDTPPVHEQTLPVVEVQHHHAHIVSVMAENGLHDAVCGVAFDGTGYGVDGAVWGGEVLITNREAFERFANFVYVPMPGGTAAIKHPLRMAYGVLWAYDLLDHPVAQHLINELGDQAEVCEAMIERGINTPTTSSVGRLFDAASAILGICTEARYEGEGAILLEACMSEAVSENVSRETFQSGELNSGADKTTFSVNAHLQNGETQTTCPSENVSRETSVSDAERYAIAITKNVATEKSTAQDTSVVLLDAQATFRALLDDLSADIPVSVIAQRFHDAFVEAVVTVAELARAVYGIETIALSGGVFMNRYLIEHLLTALEAAGFTVAVNRELPPNDGCISFGQAVVAWTNTYTNANTDDNPSAEVSSGKEE